MASSLGKFGESLAARHLEAHGYRILARNHRMGRLGELDLVALGDDGRTLCFIEVKTRSGEAYGSPAMAVTGEKRRRIRKMAQGFLQNANRLEGEAPVRFDVVEVSVDKLARNARVHHIPDAF